MKNNGLSNELEIVELLNKKRVCALPEFWIKLLCSIVPSAYGDDVVTCYKVNGNKKEDIMILLHGCQRSFSIKMGSKVTVHNEKLSTFCGFLKYLGLDEKYINFLKFYHFGDNTLDGTGKYRMSVSELQEKYQKEIDEFNEEINKPIYLRKIILRFLAFGTPYQNSHVNFLYYGTKEGGIYSNMKWLCTYLLNKEYPYSGTIHFGPFFYSPAYRGLNENLNDNNEEPVNVKRYYTNIKWISIEKDMKEFNSTIIDNLKKRDEEWKNKK